LNCTIAPLLLQPLVENAVTHGVAHLTEGGIITIAAKRNGNHLDVTVENPVDPDRSPKRAGGLGLANVRQRLDTLFGRDAALHTAQQNGTFRAELQIPIGDG
jgi:sensor histidine kinase YesM